MYTCTLFYYLKYLHNTNGVEAPHNIINYSVGCYSGLAQTTTLYYFCTLLTGYQNNHALHVNANSLKELLNANLVAKPVNGISINESSGFDCRAQN